MLKTAESPCIYPEIKVETKYWYSRLSFICLKTVSEIQSHNLKKKNSYSPRLANSILLIADCEIRRPVITANVIASKTKSRPLLLPVKMYFPLRSNTVMTFKSD